MVAVKLDVQKAYETISWPFLEACLIKLGFHSTFVVRIMKCVSSVQYKVRVNGKFTALFTSSQDLYQGDPLSQYLYIICADALTHYTTHLSNTNKMWYPKFAPGGQQVGPL